MLNKTLKNFIIIPSSNELRVVGHSNASTTQRPKIVELMQAFISPMIHIEHINSVVVTERKQIPGITRKSDRFTRTTHFKTVHIFFRLETIEN